MMKLLYIGDKVISLYNPEEVVVYTYDGVLEKEFVDTAEALTYIKENDLIYEDGFGKDLP